MNTTLIALGSNIREARRRNNLSQVDFAKACGLHRTYVSHLERGAKNATVGTLLIVARALHTTVAALTSNLALELPGQPSALESQAVSAALPGAAPQRW